MLLFRRWTMNAIAAIRYVIDNRLVDEAFENENDIRLNDMQ